MLALLKNKVARTSLVLSSLSLLALTQTSQAAVIITFSPQSDGTGTRVTTAGSIASADLMNFTTSPQTSSLGPAVLAQNNFASVPNFELVLISPDVSAGELAHVFDLTGIATSSLSNDIASGPASYVSGDLSVSIVDESIAILSHSNVLGMTAQASYVLDLVIDINNDISEFNGFSFAWDSNGAAAGGVTVASLVVPEPSVILTCFVGLTCLIPRRRRKN